MSENQVPYIQAQLAIAKIEVQAATQKVLAIEALLNFSEGGKPIAQPQEIGPDGKKKRKKKSKFDEAGNPIVKKRRNMSGYTVFVKANFVKGEEDAFKKIGAKWKEVDADEKASWKSKADEINTAAKEAEERGEDGFAAAKAKAEDMGIGGLGDEEEMPVVQSAGGDAAASSGSDSDNSSDSEGEEDDAEKERREEELRKSVKKAKKDAKKRKKDSE
jgi:hypothetical protein